ncbi:MAG TPA: hypothetical protein VG433_16905 [Pirellulales bacterium]|jgi:hypothetical protein|nr:hypothetical protein [Pirellulales bacterium]
METKFEQHDLLASLASVQCPACGGLKAKSNSLCRPCYYKLPNVMRNALYRRMGEGYEPAMKDALARLGVTEPHFPGCPRSDQR